MKRQIRQGIFETNSSSTHTLTLYNTGGWNEFTDGKVYLNDYDGTFMTEEEARKKFEEAAKKYPETWNVNDIESFDEWRFEECIYTWSEYEDRYEVLTQEVDSAGLTAVSIYGYE